jgi:diketogulonate reductase-like aldo/keto reductase
MPDDVLAQAARRRNAIASRICLAWLLPRSPAILPIPGTGSLQHLEKNQKATELALIDEQWAEIEAAVASAPGTDQVLQRNGSMRHEHVAAPANERYTIVKTSFTGRVRLFL